MNGRQVETEDDLWKLFWQGELPEDGPNGPGNRAIAFYELKSVVFGSKSSKARFPVKDSGRWYALYAGSREPSEFEPEQQAIVTQARLFSVGKAFDALIPRSAPMDLVCVHYLGVSPEKK